MNIVGGLRRRAGKLITIALPYRPGRLRQYEPRPLDVAKHTGDVGFPGCPAISIVTPSWNQGVYIARTMRSVLDQNYPRLQYIVQDNCSDDGTAYAVSAFDPMTFTLRRERDTGQADAINRGFAGTSGEIMAYLNSDDMLMPGTLMAVARHFAEHPETDVVYGHRIIIDENDQEIGRWLLPAHDDDIVVWADYIPQETMFWRRQIWEKVGGYIDESYRFALDWELILRFRRAGARFVRLPQFLGAFRVHAEQKTTASMIEIGAIECERLRRREHGRSVTKYEIHRRASPYLWKHLAYHLFFSLGFV